MQVVAGAGPDLARAVARGLDDVGLVVLDEVRVPLGVTRRGQQHRVAAGQGCEEGDDGLDVVARLEQDEPPGRPELGATGFDQRCQVGVRDRGRLRQQGSGVEVSPEQGVRETVAYLVDGHRDVRPREGLDVARHSKTDRRARSRHAACRDARDDDGVAVADARSEGGVVAEVAHVEHVGDHAVGRARRHADLLGADGEEHRARGRGEQGHPAEVAGGRAAGRRAVEQRRVTDEARHLGRSGA